MLAILIMSLIILVTVSALLQTGLETSLVVAFAILFGTCDVEGSLRHSIYISIFLVKRDHVSIDNVRFAEETKVDHHTRVRAGTNTAVRECITVNLDVPWILRVVGNGDLGFGVVEWDRQRVTRVLLAMILYLFLVVCVVPNGVDDGSFENNI